MTPKKLNLGCGSDVRAGWINLDARTLPGVDVVYDIEKVPLPFGPDEFDTVACRDILEHVDLVPVLRDIHRILKKGGDCVIRIPHFTSRRSYIDPTHTRTFSIKTFDYFVKDSGVYSEDYFDFHFDRIARSKINFEKGFFVYNHIVEPVINANRKVKEIVYEATFLSRLFPAESMTVVLVK